MRTRKATNRAVEVDEGGMSVSFCVVENALDASFLREHVRLILFVDARRSKMRFPFSEGVFNGLRGALQFCSEDCGFACLASCYGCFEGGLVG